MNKSVSDVNFVESSENPLTYILDTSVILDDIESIFYLSDNQKNIIIIPDTVIDEIDLHKKKDNFFTSHQAREFTRIFSEFQKVSHETCSINSQDVNKAIFRVIRNKQEFEIWVIGKLHYKADYNDIDKNLKNDNKIIEVAELFPNCILLSNDTGMRIRASIIGIQTEPLKRNTFFDVDNTSFIQEIPINKAWKDKLKGKKDSDFGLKLSEFTNVAFICEETNEQILCLYKKNHFFPITEKQLRSYPVQPKNREQMFFLNMLNDPDIPIVVCGGVTGSGKNLLALQGAIKYTNREPDMGIYYCRNTVTSGDKVSQIGFLKGDEHAKLSAFMYPLDDSIKKYLELEYKYYQNKGKKFSLNTKQEFMKDKNIETVNINQIRGSNLSGYIILDEWQNSPATINKMMLTRVTEGSKVVIIGDINQIDHPYLNKYNNSLALLLKKAKESNLIGAITMSKVVRGSIAAFAEKHL